MTAATPADLIARLIDAVTATVTEHADELTALDQAIGDGDHGLNMRRGFEAVMAERDTTAAKPLPDAGQKTMLDVLVPVHAALAADPRADVAAVAAEAAEATIPMKAIRGRASFLGDRSIGHMDPGARSSSLIIAAVAGVLGA